MQFPYKMRRLLILALMIIFLAIAANQGVQETEKASSKPEQKRTSYPKVPLDIDSGIIDPTIGTAKPTPTPLVSTPPVPKPAVSAEAYLVANLETGEIYAEHSSEKIFPIASLSKLVTALVSIHSMPRDEKIIITEPALDAYGDAGHFTLGETFTATEILSPLLLESSNDAAEAIALTYGYGDFIQKMNTFVTGIGMQSTAFNDASGLSSHNISNAKDLLVLAQYIYKNEKTLLELTRQTTATVGTTTDHGMHVWKTINPFPLYPNFIGGKTGRTIEAKESMVSLFDYEYGTKSYPVAVIVLRSDFGVREIDTSYLLVKLMRKLGLE